MRYFIGKVISIEPFDNQTLARSMITFEVVRGYEFAENGKFKSWKSGEIVKAVASLQCAKTEVGRIAKFGIEDFQGVPHLKHTNWQGF